MLQTVLGEGVVRCELCAHRCTLKPQAIGKCRVRENRDGALVTHTARALAALKADPIEKKPLYHVLPGSHTLSMATPGCNFRCRFCQNHELSQATPPFAQADFDLSRLSSIAESEGCRSLAFTYSEPTVFSELAFTAAQQGLAAGLPSVFVSNGYMSAAWREAFAGLVFAANIDLKAFRETTYQTLIGAHLAPVLETIRELHARGVWLEVTTLIIPGVNDDAGEWREMAAFLAGLDRELPWHLSAFHPDYRLLDAPPTPSETLLAAHAIGREAGLRHVYLGNAGFANDTHCAQCDELLIHRQGYRTTTPGLCDGRCIRCAAPLAGRFTWPRPSP